MPSGDDPGAAADTSVILPAILANQPEHKACRSALLNHHAGVPAHAWWEAVSVLTRLPIDRRVGVEDASALVDAIGPVIDMGAREAQRLRSRIRAGGIVGGAIYDAVVAWAAVSANLPLLTRDVRALPTYRGLGVEVIWVQT